MSFADAFEFYRRRKSAVRKPLLEDFFFRKFINFIEWRKERGDFPHGS